jgi:predicted CXXCH cytochrome family protein
MRFLAWVTAGFTAGLILTGLILSQGVTSAGAADDPAAKPAPKKAVKPVAKPAPKKVVKPAAKPAPKKVVKPVAKPAPKKVVKPAAKPAPKKAVKPVAKPAPKKVVKPVPPPVFVGSNKCASCHEEIYKRFIKFSAKSRSYRSIRRMERGLTPQEKKHCYDCHTTGHGRPGGFVSLAKTPLLKNVGCESCHGPGSNHAQSEEKKQIRRRVPQSVCQSCHVSARIKAFKHVPLTYGGAH